MKQLDFFIF